MNIFAEQLVLVLGHHNKNLGSLFSVRDDQDEILPGTVSRLKDSLDQDKTATLNAKQLELVQEKFGFDDEEMRLLHSAIAGEALRYMLAGLRGVDRDLAYTLGMILFRLLSTDDSATRESSYSELMSMMRHDAPEDEAPMDVYDAAEDTIPVEKFTESPVIVALDPAAEAYHRALLWRELAHESQDRTVRGGFRAQTLTWLEHAQRLATTPPSPAMGTQEQTDLLRAIQAALIELA